MRRIIALAAVAMSLLAFAPAAHAGVTACYSATVVVNGEALVDEADCLEV